MNERHAKNEFREIRVESPQGASMSALINGDGGWLMYLRHPGDAGFSSRNAAYAGPADAEIEYRLENGQVDAYPASWTYPLADVMRALAHFREQGGPPGLILWHDDSGEGASPHE